MSDPLQTLGNADRIDKAICIALDYGQIDGAHQLEMV